jgi:hypothetical protein
MRHIKTYEKLENELKIGNYVICKELDDNVDKNIERFIDNNIGIIVDFRKNNNISNDYKEIPMKYNIFVKYEDIPDEIYDDFDYHKYIDNCRIFMSNEILYSSFNKEELEEILDLQLSQNKYNL